MLAERRDKSAIMYAMTLATEATRRFAPGTTGWSVEDLDIPKIERLWTQGNYEIVEGVLTKMPAAYGDGTYALDRLRRIVEDFLRLDGSIPVFMGESDFVLSAHRVVRPDLLYLTPNDMKSQKAAHRGRHGMKIGRIIVPPTLIVESISRGHEAHDAQIKRAWYAEARVPNYWILDAFKKSLECLMLDGNKYRVDCAGTGDETVTPSAFAGMQIELASLWI
jgi:Uma2 family endonuclease